ncbi:hypothetical protein [Haloferula sp.]|uniref:hypothetical protein n=1 Tax=Haloferula sp. TaxID=2497595 RepID=UPI003C7506B6
MTVVMMMMRTRRAVRIVVVPVIIRRWRVMIPFRVTDVLNLDAWVRQPAVGHQQSPAHPGKNAEDKQAGHKSKHGAKKQQIS